MTHATNLQRVTDNIGDVVYEFCRRHVGWHFHATELRGFVQTRCTGIAPESPGRILRELRKQGRVQYELVSRRGSLYRVVAVRP